MAQWYCKGIRIEILQIERHYLLLENMAFHYKMLITGPSSYIEDSMNQGRWLFSKGFTNLMEKKMLPTRIELTLLRLPGQHSTNRPQKQGCSEIFCKYLKLKFNGARESRPNAAKYFPTGATMAVWAWASLSLSSVATPLPPPPPHNEPLLSFPAVGPPLNWSRVSSPLSVMPLQVKD